MAWIAVDLDDTLVDANDQPTPGAVEAMTQLVQQGHRVSIWTARFHTFTESEKEREKRHITQQLESVGIPFTDIWDGPKPQADIFVGDNNLTFTGDWTSTLDDVYMMLDHKGPVPEPEVEDVGPSQHTKNQT